MGMEGRQFRSRRKGYAQWNIVRDHLSIAFVSFRLLQGCMTANGEIWDHFSIQIALNCIELPSKRGG